MGKVSLVRTGRGMKESLRHALDLIGGLERYVRRGDTVLLKPNLNGAEGFTDRDLVEALIQLLSDFGVGRIFLAESTFGDGRMTDLLFRKTGYFELAAKYGIDLFNLNESEAVEVAVKHPLVLEKLRIAREVYEADRIINLPNMKVHYATGITLALKNLKGVLVGNQKRQFHEVGLDKAIVDLNNTVRAHLNVVDAIACMERMGPRGGDIVRLDLIMAGENAAEVDCVGCDVMGFDRDEVGHLKRYIDANGVDPGGIEVVGESIGSVRHPFKKVALGGTVHERFRIRDKNACCACMNAFLLSCTLLDGDPPEIADVHMGSLPDGREPSGGMRIAFGNCCPEDRDFDLRIKGCPPYPFALNEFLKKKG